jgi:hypothetical protein
MLVPNNQIEVHVLKVACNTAAIFYHPADKREINMTRKFDNEALCA